MNAVVAIDQALLAERRRRLAAEHILARTRRDLGAAHAALVAQADRLSRRFLAEQTHAANLRDRVAGVKGDLQRQAEAADRARRRLWHALEAMRDGFALFDADDRLIAANSVFLQLCDAGSTAGPGRSAREILVLAAEEGAFVLDASEAPEDWADMVLARWQQDPIPPLVLTTFDGRALRVQERRAPDGDLVLLAVDVTEARRRQADLAAERDAAASQARSKSEFLARMSHEIRTPLNGVTGLADLLIEGAPDDGTREMARVIRDSAEALLVIVSDALDMSRLDAGRMELRTDRFDLEATLADALRLAAAGRDPARRPVATALAWPLDLPTEVLGDAGRIRQVVMNLLGNAMKVVEAGSVVVEVNAANGADVLDRDVTIRVRDTGPGIPPALRAHVFGAFNQVPGALAEGTGLGLTIARGLADRMGGTLELEQAPDRQGATFAFRLPLRLAAPARPAPPWPERVALRLGEGPAAAAVADVLHRAGVELAADRAAPVLMRVETATSDGPLPADFALLGEAPADLAGRARHVGPWPPRRADLLAALGALAAPADRPAGRVLCADDNATNRYLLSRLLDGVGVPIELVENGAEAVAACRAAMPAAVVLDLSMPVMDGWAAAAAIQAAAAEAGVVAPPLLALTAHDDPDLPQRLAAVGFQAHLTKPIRKDVLIRGLVQAGVAAISETEPVPPPPGQGSAAASDEA